MDCEFYDSIYLNVYLSYSVTNMVWFGTHKEYDKIDAKKVSYVKTDKK